MQSDGLDGGGMALGAHPTPTGPAHPDKQENKQKNTAQAQQEEAGARSSLGASVGNGDPALLTVVISVEESHAQVPMIPELNPHGLKATGADMDEIIDVASSRKGCLTRSDSSHEQCRVCQQQTDEVLINLGCRCRGGLANAHLSCIEIWFRTKGSNKCEICQQVAVNVPPPESQTNYWVWRVDPAHRGSSNVVQGRERGCFNPLWVAFSILIGGLLLDVLISISLGVSALPVNIIIGVLIVLGLGTALRLALECCHEWSLRRVVQRVESNVDVGYHPAV